MNCLIKHFPPCYSLCWSIFVSILQSNFRPIPALYAKIPAFYSGIFLPSSSVFHRWFSPFMSMESVHAAIEKEREGGVTQVGKTVRTCAREIILGRNLLRQSEALCQVPVWTPVVQVTGEAISADDSWVRPHNRNCGSAIVIATYMWNGFIHFHCHESTQICEYAQGILS